MHGHEFRKRTGILSRDVEVELTDMSPGSPARCREFRVTIYGTVYGTVIVPSEIRWQDRYSIARPMAYDMVVSKMQGDVA